MQRTDEIPNNHITILMYENILNQNGVYDSPYSNSPHITNICNTLLDLEKQKKIICLKQEFYSNAAINSPYQHQLNDILVNMLILSIEIMIKLFGIRDDIENIREQAFENNFLDYRNNRDIKFILSFTNNLFDFIENNNAIKKSLEEAQFSDIGETFLFKNAISIAKDLIYGDIILTEDMRNDINILLEAVQSDKLFALHKTFCNILCDILQSEQYPLSIKLYEQIKDCNRDYFSSLENHEVIYGKNPYISSWVKLKKLAIALSNDKMAKRISFIAQNNALPIFVLVSRDYTDHLSLSDLLEDNFECTCNIIPINQTDDYGYVIPTFDVSSLHDLASMGNIGNQSLLERIRKNDRQLKHIDLSGRFLTLDYLKALTAAFENNTTVTEIDFSDKVFFGPSELFTNAITDLINSIPALSCIRLSKCGLGPLFASSIATFLPHNKQLKELNLSDNQIGSEGAIALFQALQTNTTLENLNLKNNEIGYLDTIDICKLIGETLKIGVTALTTLNLDNNFYDYSFKFYMDFKGLESILDGLENNYTLTHFKLNKFRNIMNGSAQNMTSFISPASSKKINDISLRNNKLQTEKLLGFIKDYYLIFYFGLSSDPSNHFFLPTEVRTYILLLTYLTKFKPEEREGLKTYIKKMNAKTISFSFDTLISVSKTCLDQFNFNDGYNWKLKREIYSFLTNDDTEIQKKIDSIDYAIQIVLASITSGCSHPFHKKSLNQEMKLFCEAFYCRDVARLQQLSEQQFTPTCFKPGQK